MIEMAYPIPIPKLNKKDTKNFLTKLNDFKLTKKQKIFYKKGFENFKGD